VGVAWSDAVGGEVELAGAVIDPAAAQAHQLDLLTLGQFRLHVGEGPAAVVASFLPVRQAAPAEGR
jgi:hypothetical protein